MAKYRVQRQFTSWDEVTFWSADSVEEALEFAQNNWHELPLEGVGEYEPTGKWLVINDNTGEEREM